MAAWLQPTRGARRRIKKAGGKGLTQGQGALAWVLFAAAPGERQGCSPHREFGAQLLQLHQRQDLKQLCAQGVAAGGRHHGATVAARGTGGRHCWQERRCLLRRGWCTELRPQCAARRRALAACPQGMPAGRPPSPSMVPRPPGRKMKAVRSLCFMRTPGRGWDSGGGARVHELQAAARQAQLPLTGSSD